MSTESVPLSSPCVTEEDIAAVVSVLRTPRLALGPQLDAFEQAVASYVGTRHAVAVNSGTSALHLCIRALGIGEGDEVITSPFSFIASSNCILFERATPVFADIEPASLCIDPRTVEQAITKKTKAILAVDVFGQLADWDALRAIAEKHHLALIEDSCEAIGSSRGNAMAGTFGDCGTFAFYPNKQMTTGEGGMVVTDRDDIAAYARAARNQGRAPGISGFEHEILGFNYRISDINCALGKSQLRHMPAFMVQRQRVVDWYGEELADCTDLTLPQPQAGVSTSWFVYVVRLSERFGLAQRDALLAHLRSQGIGCNNYFPAIHLQPLYRKAFGFSPGMFPVTESVAERTIALPFFTTISRKDVASVCKILKDGLLRLAQGTL